jgi:hypothetical protein
MNEIGDFSCSIPAGYNADFFCSLFAWLMKIMRRSHTVKISGNKKTPF